LGNGLTAIISKNYGLVIRDDNAHTSYTLSDANGICSNDISYATFDGRGQYWVATGKGIFSVQIPSSYSRFTAKEGLSGSVLSIASLNGRIYAGTDDGLFRQEGKRFVKVNGINHATWDLKNYGNDLLAATAEGIYRLSPDGKISHLTNTTSFVLQSEGDLIYSGELNGIYQISDNGQNRKRVCNLENVRKMLKDQNGVIWVQSLYGAIWYKKPGRNFMLYKIDKSETMSTIVPVKGKVEVISAVSTKPFPYPLFSFLDEKGAPNMVERAKILFPLSQIGAITEGQRNDIIRQSRIYGKYDEPKERDSAFEMLIADAERQLAEAEKQETEIDIPKPAEGKAEKKKPGMMSKVWKAVLTAITSTLATILGTYVSDKVTGKKTKSKTSATGRVVKNATSAATRSITKELTRDILGNLVK
jgi:hypothetical protein